ncbi:MAG: fluoride efflux transporter CrcB [Bacteroidota bacterium]
MRIIIAIGAGSFIGGISRYLLSQFIHAKFLSTFPLGTLSVNIIGCFLIGLVFGYADKGALTQEWRLFLATGLIGGFTTFSAFSNETVGLLRDGQLWYASAYIVVSIGFGLFTTLIGTTIIKFL